MPLLGRWGRPLPEAPKHVRALGFHGGTRPLKDDEDVVEFHQGKVEMPPSDSDAPAAI